MKYTCQCCGYKTLTEPQGNYDICSICFWEDDIVQNENPFYCGGANKVSLYQAQLNYKSFGVSELRFRDKVRLATQDDEVDKNWKPAILSEDRQELIVIDLFGITSIEELHGILKNALLFPKFYGMNWDAFWDAITGLVEMPRRIKFLGWYELEIKFPKDARILKQSFEELKDEYPNISPKVEYYEYK